MPSLSLSLTISLGFDSLIKEKPEEAVELKQKQAEELAPNAWSPTAV